MHNGVFDSLRDAVAFYFTRDTKPQLWYPGGRKFDDLLRAWHGNVNTDEVPYDRRLNQRPRATEAEVDALVAFLRTLTDRPAR
jgi:cytochrome c peroxidase